jgi:hypothetical protein
MRLINKQFVISAAVAAAFALALPAGAAAQRNNNRNRGGGQQSHAERAAPRGPSQGARTQSAPRQAAPRAVAPRGVNGARPQVVQPSRQFSQSQRFNRQVSPRFEGNRSGFGFRGGVVGHASPRFFNSRSVFALPRNSFRVARPYYSFRSRFSLGLGLYVGYPVAFPYWYDPYAYAYDYPGYVSPDYASPYGYPDSSYETSTQAGYGGLSFDIQPADAGVYIDGTYVGIVTDFGPDQAPLTLTAGRHHVELRAQGCDPMSFDITTVPGQVIPYQGTMSYTR